MDLARPSPSLTSPELLSISARPFATSPRLGDQGCHIPCSPPTLFSVPNIHGATTGWETPCLIIDMSPLNPFILDLQFHLDSNACPGSLATSPHGGARHFGGLHPHPHPPQPSSLPRLLVSKPTLLFSGSPIRSQCGTVHIHQGHELATPHPSHPGDQYPSLLDDIVLWHHSPLILRQHVTRNHRETLCHRVSGQPPEIPTGTSNDSPMAGHPLASADRSLAGVTKHPGQNPVVYPPASSHRPHHPQAPRGSGGSHQLCLSGAQPFEGLPPTSHGRSVPGFPPGQRSLSPHSPSTPPGFAVLGVAVLQSQHLGVRPSLSGDSPPSLSVD